MNTGICFLYLKLLHLCETKPVDNCSPKKWFILENDDVQGGGEEVWDPLREAGLLDSQDATTQPTSQGQEVAAAVSSRQVTRYIVGSGHHHPAHQSGPEGGGSIFF